MAFWFARWYNLRATGKDGPRLRVAFSFPTLSHRGGVV